MVNVDYEGLGPTHKIPYSKYMAKGTAYKSFSDAHEALVLTWPQNGVESQYDPKTMAFQLGLNLCKTISIPKYVLMDMPTNMTPEAMAEQLTAMALEGFADQLYLFIKEALRK